MAVNTQLAVHICSFANYHTAEEKVGQIPVLPSLLVLSEGPILNEYVGLC